MGNERWNSGAEELRKFAIILFVITLTLPTLYGRWGWGSHRFINDAAVDHLPAAMSFFQDHRDYLSDHSTDPDTDQDPGNYHYIDIDYYPEFFAGTLPHTWEDMIALYGQDIMEENGLIPWVIDWWMADLTTLMENGSWDDVWQVAAELGHYVGDSHQALHLTLNYNGQLTGNYGIHSRYETHLINPHLSEISFPDSVAHYWENPLDSIFAYIEDIYPLVDMIIEADDRAITRDPNYHDAYYTHMWEDLEDVTIWSLNRAVVDLANIWYTAWVNAGSPFPPGVGVDNMQVPVQYELNNFPNPFNPTTTIQFGIPELADVHMMVYDVRGRLVQNIELPAQSPGWYEYMWNGTNLNGEAVGTGVYFCRLNAGDYSKTIKMLYLK